MCDNLLQSVLELLQSGEGSGERLVQILHLAPSVLVGPQVTSIPYPLASRQYLNRMVR